MFNKANQIPLPQQYYGAGIYHLISRHLDLLFSNFETEEHVGCSVLVTILEVMVSIPDRDSRYNYAFFCPS